MRSRFKLSLSDMLKQHRRWERTLAKAVKITRKAVVSATSAPAPVPATVVMVPAESTWRTRCWSLTPIR